MLHEIWFEMNEYGHESVREEPLQVYKGNENPKKGEEKETENDMIEVFEELHERDIWNC